MAKVGDRVRITVEGVLRWVAAGDHYVSLEGGNGATLLTSKEWTAAKVEVLDDPRLAVIEPAMRRSGLSAHIAQLAARDILGLLDAAASKP